MASAATNVSKIERNDAGEDVREQLAALRSDVAGLTSAMGDYVREQKHYMQSKAASGIDALKDAGKAGLKATSDKASAVKASTEDLVRENPASAIAISAGLGFVLGLMTRRH
jgi:ElaB/YqjD/DUF883 family membrane-anchored ribosome-binding protein